MSNINNIEQEVKVKTETWFNSNKQRNTLLIISIMLVIGLLFSFRSCNNLKSDLLIDKQNQSSLTDSIRVTVNKAKEIESSRDILISDNKNLMNLNTNLATELKKENGKVFELNSIIASLRNKPGDTVYIKTTIIKYPDGSLGLSWKYDSVFNSKNSRHIYGISKFKLKDSLITNEKTFITKDEINFNIVTGLRQNKDGKMEIFVRSDYPGFNITSLEGSILDTKDNPIFKTVDKPKRWGIGPYIGVGIGSSIIPSIQIGIGLSYSIIKF